MSININPKWQLDVPGDFPQSRDARVDFGDPLGEVRLPSDYLAFMRASDGAVLRDRDGWFLARFPAGTVIAEIDYLNEMQNVVRTSRGLSKTFTDRPGPAIPPRWIAIGFSEAEYMQVLLCADEASQEYGHVCGWYDAGNDPWMEGENTRGLGHVSDSFTTFMNGLTERGNL